MAKKQSGGRQRIRYVLRVRPSAEESPKSTWKPEAPIPDELPPEIARIIDAIAEDMVRRDYAALLAQAAADTAAGSGDLQE